MKLIISYFLCLSAYSVIKISYSFSQKFLGIAKLIQHGIPSAALFISLQTAPSDHLIKLPSSASLLPMSVSTSSIISSKGDSLIPSQQYIKDDFIRGLLSGAVSRASKEILLHPFDTIRARLQVKKVTVVNATRSSYSSKSSASVSTSILESQKKVDGNVTVLFQDLYAGLAPALIGGIPAGAVFFAVKDSVKSYIKSLDNPFDSSSVFSSKEFITILSVVVANVFYWMVRSPAEELKTKQQVGQNTTEFANFKYIAETYREKGPQGVIQLLYGSYSSNIMYALPADILKFVACK